MVLKIDNQEVNQIMHRAIGVAWELETDEESKEFMDKGVKMAESKKCSDDVNKEIQKLLDDRSGKLLKEFIADSAGAYLMAIQEHCSKCQASVEGTCYLEGCDLREFSQYRKHEIAPGLSI